MSNKSNFPLGWIKYYVMFSDKINKSCLVHSCLSNTPGLTIPMFVSTFRKPISSRLHWQFTVCRRLLSLSFRCCWNERNSTVIFRIICANLWAFYLYQRSKWKLRMQKLRSLRLTKNNQTPPPPEKNKKTKNSDQSVSPLSWDRSDCNSACFNYCKEFNLTNFRLSDSFSFISPNPPST